MSRFNCAEESHSSLATMSWQSAQIKKPQKTNPLKKSSTSIIKFYKKKNSAEYINLLGKIKRWEGNLLRISEISEKIGIKNNHKCENIALMHFLI